MTRGGRLNGAGLAILVAAVVRCSPGGGGSPRPEGPASGAGGALRQPEVLIAPEASGVRTEKKAPPHPVPVEGLLLEVIQRALEVAALREDFALVSAWQVRGGLHVATGYIPARGAPGMVILYGDGTALFRPFPVQGTPGPARIREVRGEWVIIHQGRGTMAYNYRTGLLRRADDPLVAPLIPPANGGE